MTTNPMTLEGIRMITPYFALISYALAGIVIGSYACLIINHRRGISEIRDKIDDVHVLAGLVTTVIIMLAVLLAWW